jgi:hypothetical protein
MKGEVCEASFLEPYSLEFDPFEEAFSKVQGMFGVGQEHERVRP